MVQTQLPELPLILGTQNVAAGTYMAEQRTKESYDLLAVGSRRTKVNASPRRRNAGQRFEQIKCTILPALTTIDPLLAPTTVLEREEEKTLRLPTIMEPRMPENRKDILSRLYPGRCCSTQLGEAETPVPSDAEFNEWLKFPCHASNVRHSGNTERLSPTVMTVPSPSCESNTTLVTESQELNSWYILLFRSTFEDIENTPAHVARCLVDVLDLDPDSAKQKVKDAQRCVMVLLARCENRTETFRKVLTLRGAGLVVQVVSEIGLPGEMGTENEEGGQKARRRFKAKDGYSELFKASLRGTELAGQGRSPSAFLIPSVKGQQRRGGVIGALYAPVFHAARKSVGHKENKGSLKTMVMKHKDKIKLAMLANQTQMTSGLKDDATGGGEAVTKEDEKSFGDPGSTAGAGGSLWGTVLDAVLPSNKITPVRKEACQMLRFFVFGSVGNEIANTAKEREKIFYESIGTKDKVQTLFNLWHRLDEDGSGRVDITEFRHFAEQNMKEKVDILLHDVLEGAALGPITGLPSWANIKSSEDTPKFISNLCDKLAQLLLGKKSSFVIEDMMRLIWPCAQISDLKVMGKWCKEFTKSVDKKRIKTPPTLPHEEFEGLCSVFRYFDDDASGSVMLEELVSTGLIYEDQAATYFRDWDKNGDSSLELLEFCEMMCPSGYRAHPKAEIGSRPDGVRVIFDRKLNCWRLEESEDDIPTGEGNLP